MITVSIKQLVSAVEEAGAFKLPDMSDGAKYLYSNLYERLSKGEDVMLSNLNFDAFESDDITELNSLHSDVFEKNNCKADDIMSALRKTVPVCKVVGYV